MEIKRTVSDGSVLWSVKGSLDDDFMLHLESMILNSQDRSGKVFLDISGLEDIPPYGPTSFAHMSGFLSERGRDLEIIGAKDDIVTRLKKTKVLDQ